MASTGETTMRPDPELHLYATKPRLHSYAARLYPYVDAIMRRPCKLGECDVHMACWRHGHAIESARRLAARRDR